MTPLVRIALILLVELLLYGHMLTGNRLLGFASGDVFVSLNLLLLAALGITLVGWGLNVPSLFRGWRVVAP